MPVTMDSNIIELIGMLCEKAEYAVSTRYADIPSIMNKKNDIVNTLLAVDLSFIIRM